MLLRNAWSFGAWGLSILALAGCGEPPPSADLIFLNATIHTLNPLRPTADTVAVRDGAIVCVGSALDCQAYHGSTTEAIDATGKTLVPGFADSHAHLMGIGLREMTLNLADLDSLDALLETVAKRTETVEPGEWISGRGWIEARWEKPVFPTRYDLDKVAPDNPVWLIRADGHSGIANSAALRIAGIHEKTASPAGGEIIRDAQGKATGMLVDAARELVTKHVPAPTPEAKKQALKVGAEYAAKMGWTQLGIAGTSWDEVAMLHGLLDEGDMPIRTYIAILGPGPDADRLIQMGPQAEDSRLVVRGIKLYMDGSLGSQSAALLEPYEDRSGKGIVMHDEEELRPTLDGALKSGIQVETHAIGDLANRLTLDYYERAFARVPRSQRAVVKPRWRVEHAQILAPDDLPRFAKLEVIPSMQASHAITDMHFALRRLGAERLKGAYAWRSLVDSGVVIPGGSDAPVEKGDPIVEFYAAAVRKDLDGSSADYWHPEQKLEREEALKMLTSWAAYASFQEDERGTIEAGKWADLTLLSQDILTVPEEEILKTKIEMTVVGGKVVYRNK
jgi:predicted amidohydrolase YtcJ